MTEAVAEVGNICSITENLQTPICGKYDVIVAGGGPAGVGAAIASGRAGVKTLLIERYGFLGGMWTAGLINPIFDTKNKGGILSELIDKLGVKGAWGGFNGICHDYEELKLLLDETVYSSGVEVLLHSHICGAIAATGSKERNENIAVTGVKVENKSGRQAYMAKVVIDCTGDGDVAASAGAHFMEGRGADGLTQPMTMMFILGNVKFRQDNGKQLYEMMKTAVEKHKTGYNLNYDFPYIIQLPKGNYAVVQLTHIRGLSATNAYDITKAEIEGRRQVMDTFDFFKKYIPEFNDLDLVYTAPQIGIRESRRITGEYILTRDDVVSGAHFQDGITTVSFGIDIHCPDSTGQLCYKVKPYQIPYRCLIPKGIDGLLTAGRCISGDYDAHASYRVTGNCIAMGEAAGKAAAISVMESALLRKIDASRLISK